MNRNVSGAIEIMGWIFAVMVAIAFLPLIAVSAIATGIFGGLFEE